MSNRRAHSRYHSDLQVGDDGMAVSPIGFMLSAHDDGSATTIEGRCVTVWNSDGEFPDREFPDIARELAQLRLLGCKIEIDADTQTDTWIDYVFTIPATLNALGFERLELILHRLSMRDDVDTSEWM